MFYELDKLESQLKCPKCLLKYVSPRILPCGKSLCQNCIDQLCNYNLLNFIKCPICCKSHAVPDEGFIINEFIVKTLDIKPEKVYRCASYEQFDTLLNEIESDLIEIETRLNYPENKIRDYCDKIRNQIDLNTEKLIEKINNHREQLLNELSIYEQNCIENLMRIERKDLYEKILNENSQKIKSYYNYLNQSRINEDQVKQMIEEAKIQEYKLKNNIKILNSKLFGKNLIHFEESTKILDSNILGKITYDDLNFTSDLTDIEKVLNCKIEKTITYNDKIIDYALPIQDIFLLVVGPSLKMVDDTGNDILDIRFDSTPLHVSHNQIDTILVQHRRCLWRNDRKEISQAYTLSTYDFNLNIKNEIVIDSKIINCITNEHSVFIQMDKTNLINVYNWNLEKLLTIGQTLYADRPYFCKDYTIEMVKGDRVYMRKTMPDEEGDYWVRIMSLSSGDLLHEYYLDCRHEFFFVDGLMRSIVIDPVFSILRIYDRPNLKSNQADLLFEKSLDLNNCNGFQMTSDGKFFFIKEKKFVQYYKFSA
ncbi:unnamed protein product [Brachionus calyciflorus]|uniref:RING-type domain-containing protein n=1 Tax=Brachionus calyciflorus TaxID=104777 RepID=A0A813PXS3_9BILA|nr:unnamed protein product [Brachionus calyciflorus]